MNYTHYIRTNDRIIIVPSQHFMQTIQDIYYDIDRVRYGGTKSMRGFREDQFRLAGFALTSIEGRWMLSSSSYLYSFVSGAYTWTPDKLGTRNNKLDYSTLFSSGFGISYRVRPGILNVSYAVSNDDSWLNGKIHFGITNSF
jgi:outer membrane protein insertion porin family